MEVLEVSKPRMINTKVVKRDLVTGAMDMYEPDYFLKKAWNRLRDLPKAIVQVGATIIGKKEPVYDQSRFHDKKYGEKLGNFAKNKTAQKILSTAGLAGAAVSGGIVAGAIGKGLQAKAAAGSKVPKVSVKNLATKLNESKAGVLLQQKTGQSASNLLKDKLISEATGLVQSQIAKNLPSQNQVNLIANDLTDPALLPMNKATKDATGVFVEQSKQGSGINFNDPLIIVGIVVAVIVLVFVIKKIAA